MKIIIEFLFVKVFTANRQYFQIRHGATAKKKKFFFYPGRYLSQVGW